MRRRVRETQSTWYLSRRKPGSAWSKANTDRVAKLRAHGSMTPAGELAIELAIARAQASRAWDRLAASDQFELPPELVQQLEATPAARAFFDSLPPSSHRILLEWI